MQDVKMTDQFAGHEIARQEIARHENAGHENAEHENDVPKMTIGREMAGEKSTVSTEIMNELCKFLNPQHCNTLCIREGA